MPIHCKLCEAWSLVAIDVDDQATIVELLEIVGLRYAIDEIETQVQMIAAVNPGVRDERRDVDYLDLPRGWDRNY